MKPKLTDVARFAGVSLATADRVVNKRPGVRESTRRKVFEAIATLGYQPDPLAASLARSERKKIAVILPTDILGIYQAVVRDWNRVRKSSHLLRAQLQLMPYSPTSRNGILDCLSQAEKTADGILLCSPDWPEVHERTSRMTELGMIVHTFMTDLSGGNVRKFAGFDNYRLGRTIAYFMMMFTQRSNGVLYMHPYFPDAMAHKLRLAGFRDYAFDENWGAEMLTHLEFGGKTSCDALVKHISSQTEPVIGILSHGDSCLEGILEQCDKRSDADRPRVIVLTMDVTARMVNAIVNDQIDAIFLLDVTSGIEQAMSDMIVELENSKTPKLEKITSNLLLDPTIYVKENLPLWCLKLIEETIK